VWGFGVDFADTFGARTAEALGGWHLSNWGMPGYGIDQVGLALRSRALPEKPDLVIVGIFPHDFERSLESFRSVEGMCKPSFALADGELVERTTRDRPNSAMRWLERNSYLWNALQLDTWTFARYVPVTEWWSLNAALIERMHDDCKRAGVEVLFVYIPTSTWRGFPALARWMRRLDAHYLDPVELHPERPADLYFAVDKHLNAAGHAWLADRIVEWLRANAPGLFEGS
jgi:hypothetical protein